MWGRQPPFYFHEVSDMAETRPFCKASFRLGSRANMQTPAAMGAVPTRPLTLDFRRSPRRKERHDKPANEMNK
jgi:hypothetical protein